MEKQKTVPSLIRDRTAVKGEPDSQVILTERGIDFSDRPLEEGISGRKETGRYPVWEKIRLRMKSTVNNKEETELSPSENCT